MKIMYKKVKLAMPHCGNCGERLHGDGSIVFPYYCSCGTWTSNFLDPGNYYLKEGGEKK